MSVVSFEVYDRQHDGNIHLLGRRQVDMSEFYFRRGNIFEGTVEVRLNSVFHSISKTGFYTTFISL